MTHIRTTVIELREDPTQISPPSLTIIEEATSTFYFPKVSWDEGGVVIKNYEGWDKIVLPWTNVRSIKEKTEIKDEA